MTGERALAGCGVRRRDWICVGPSRGGRRAPRRAARPRRSVGRTTGRGLMAGAASWPAFSGADWSATGRLATQRETVVTLSIPSPNGDSSKLDCDNGTSSTRTPVPDRENQRTASSTLHRTRMGQLCAPHLQAKVRPLDLSAGSREGASNPPTDDFDRSSGAGTERWPPLPKGSLHIPVTHRVALPRLPHRALNPREHHPVETTAVHDRFTHAVQQLIRFMNFPQRRQAGAEHVQEPEPLMDQKTVDLVADGLRPCQRRAHVDKRGAIGVPRRGDEPVAKQTAQDGKPPVDTVEIVRGFPGDILPGAADQLAVRHQLLTKPPETPFIGQTFGALSR